MRDRDPERLGAAVALVAAAGAAILVVAAGRPAPSGADAEFQRALGGFGSGSATALVPCPGALDGGLAGGCAAAAEPAPGGLPYCPHHSGPSLRR